VNRFEENFSIISQQKTPHFIAEMDSEEVPFHYVGKDQDEVKIFCRNDQPFVIDPNIDNTRLPKPNLRQLIFFFGIVSLKEIKEVARSAHKESLFVIIEPNLYFLQHAMLYEDFKMLENINYIIVTKKSDNLAGLFQVLFYSNFFYLIQNAIFYLNSYYRKYDGSLVKEYIIKIGEAIKNRYFKIGNSIHDSLIGLINNLNNIKAVSENLDVARLKNAFVGVPAFIVAAGPSLDKNIRHLKNAQGKGLIIAVDTIAQKLLDNGIVPDFICTVERGTVVWDYFYENKNYPDSMYLVSSLVADPRIIKKFENRAILPMRTNVREYVWLEEKLGLNQEHYMWMGASCAHIAMGLALHTGASPIVMIGQDLATGDKGTHADGTIYDEKPLDEEPDLWVKGYYGRKVRTRKVWIEFKRIFEDMITSTADRIFINATEGGARIEGTQQQALLDVVKKYCNKECNVSIILNDLPRTFIEWVKVEAKMRCYIHEIEELRKNVAGHLAILTKFQQTWNNSMPEKKIKKIYRTMQETDVYYRAIASDQLLLHNLQGPLMVLIQKFQTIEETESLISLKANLDVQIELCEMIESTAWLITQVIEENYPWSDYTENV